MKQHSEELIAYVIEFSGLSREKAVEWLDRNLPRLKGDEDEIANGDGKDSNSPDSQGNNRTGRD